MIISRLPALITFAAIRVFVQTQGGVNLIEQGLHYIHKLRYPLVWYGLLVNPFLPSVLLPAIFFRDTAEYLRKNIHMAVFFLLILVSAFFGSNNERLMAPAFIPFFILTGHIIERNFIQHRVLVIFLLAAGLLSSMHHTIARYPLPTRNYTIVLSGGGAVLVTAIFLVFSLYQRKSRL